MSTTLSRAPRMPGYAWLRGLAALLAAVVFEAAPALAQLDSDPGNDTAAGANALSLAVGSATTNNAKLAAPGNDVDFFSVSLDAGEVLLGMTTPLNNLPTLFDDPDTIASVMLNGSQLTYSDDDQADELPFPVDGSGNRASLFRFYSSASNTYHVGITGYDDQQFDGTTTGSGHPEVGNYALTIARINPTVVGGAFLDTDPTNSTFGGADTITTSPTGASVAVSQLQANDVDYYALNLTQGQIVSIMTAPLEDLPFSFDVPDTLIALFNSSGTQIVVNDDAGDEGNSDLNPDLGSDNPIANSTNVIWGSAMRALVPATGVYYLGVTGYGDDNFTGDHSEFGKYSLLVGTFTPPAQQSGDFDNNGVFDARDYVIWRNGFGTLYDMDDYNDWRANFGSPPGVGSGGQVPEPATISCLLIGVCIIGRRRWIEGRTE